MLSKYKMHVDLPSECHGDLGRVPCHPDVLGFPPKMPKLCENVNVSFCNEMYLIERKHVVINISTETSFTDFKFQLKEIKMDFCW
jgi:hypothetical protein